MQENELIKVNGNNYLIKKLIGKGKGGYCYLAITNNKEVVVKKIHHEPCDYYTFGDKFESEINAYNVLSKLIDIPLLIDSNKEQEIIIKEYIPGKTIDERVKNKEDISKEIEIIKLIQELLIKNNVNIDYYPTNFIFYNDKLYYVDYEYNNYDSKWNFDNWGVNYRK